MEQKESPQGAAEKLLSFFAYEHLSPGPLRDMGRRYSAMAHEIYHVTPQSAEATTALRKLLESKDCAVRSLL